MHREDRGFSILRRLARDEIVHLLESVMAENIDLHVDESLMKPLDRVAGAKLLKQHGVSRIFKFDASITTTALDASRHHVFLLRPTMKNAKLTAESIANHKAQKANATTGGRVLNRQFTVVFVPRSRYICEDVFERSGLFGDLAIESYNLLLIPLETDILSLEDPSSFAYFLDDSSPVLNAVARSIQCIRNTFGDIPNVFGMGKAAELCHKIAGKLEDGPSHNLEFQISHMFLFDRTVDFASVFFTGLTYEALLTEHFDVKCGFIDFPPSVTKSQKFAKFLLTNEDEIYASIRNRHFSTVFAFLSERARALQVSFDQKANLETVKQMKSFVTDELRTLQTEHRSLTHHIGACEEILGKKTAQDFEEQLAVEQAIIAGKDFKNCVEFIENWMCQQLTDYVALSLICLISICQEGIELKYYRSLRMQFLHAYGHKHLVTWYNLRRLGILVEKKVGGPAATQYGQQWVGNLLKSSTFSAVCKKYQLFSLADAISYKNPLDMSYVFNGAYIPLVCQIVQQTLMYDNFNVDDLSKFFDTPFVKEATSNLKPSMDKVVLVYFIGGVTHAEIACLRWLAQKRNFHVVIATTHVISRQHLVKDLSVM